MAQWEDSPQGWRVSSLLEDAPTNLGVMRDANMVEINGQDGLPSSDLDDYRTAGRFEPMDKKRIVERPARFESITGKAEAENGGKLNDPPARSDNQNRSNPGPDSFSVADSSGVENGNVNEVQNGSCRQTADNGRSDNSRGADYGRSNHASGNDSQAVSQSAGVNSPALVAAFDAGLAHVETAAESGQLATCAKPPEVEASKTAYTPSELSKWAMENYAIDPVQNSRNRWRIRIRCRKSGCVHSDHLHLKTVSFMSDSAYRKLTRSKAKYECWKKATIAENAATLRKG